MNTLCCASAGGVRGKRGSRVFFFFAALFVFVLSQTPVFASTNVSEIISTDTTWTLAGSPYIVTGNVKVYSTISPAPVLTIEPGVVVKFNQNTTLYIGNSGTPGALYAVN